MRHKYDTRGIVLARTTHGEANALITLLTPTLGLVRARAQGVRHSGAKLAPALTTFAESSVVLVRGQEGWRLAGAVLETPWFTRLERSSARDAAGRVSGLLMRLMGGDIQDPNLFSLMIGFVHALETLPEEQYDAAEILAVLRIIAALGFDVGDLPGTDDAFTPSLLEDVKMVRGSYVSRINRGIDASGL